MRSLKYSNCNIFFYFFAAGLSGFGIFRWWLGPMLMDLVPLKAKKTPFFKRNMPFGVIYCGYPFYRVLKWLPYHFTKSLPSFKETDIVGCKERIKIENFKHNPLENPKVVNATINFLEKGKFS